MRAMKLAGAMLACALAAPGALAAEGYDPGRVLGSVEESDLAAVVGALGHAVTSRGDGEPYVVARTPEGTVYLLMGTACDVGGVPGCQGIMMQVRITLPPGTTPETLAAANLGQAVITTAADVERRTLIFSRYLVLDHGVTMANIGANIDALLVAVPVSYPVAAGEE